MYRYDTHVHTSEGSLCGKMTGEEMARFYKDLGYDGIIITDHFLNGNTTIPESLSWEEKVRLFALGYERARAEGERLGLDVFFGFEFNFKYTEFLVYGLDVEWLLAHPDCDKLGVREFCELAHGSGAFIVHAHPFRMRPYIKAIRLYPDCIDAVEVMNAAHLDDMPHDRRAEWYAEEFGFLRTAGSDNHVLNQRYLGGIETEERIESIDDYIKAAAEGKLRILRFENPHFDGLSGHGLTVKK